MHSGRGEWYRWTLGTVVHSGAAQVSRRRTGDPLCSQYHHPLWHPPDCQPCVLCPCPSPTCHWNWAIFYLPEKKTISLLPVSQFYVWGEVWDLTISVFTFWVFMAGWLFILCDSSASHRLKIKSSLLSLVVQEKSLMSKEVRFCHIRTVFMFLTRHDCVAWQNVTSPEYPVCTEACDACVTGRGNDRPGPHNDTIITPGPGCSCGQILIMAPPRCPLSSGHHESVIIRHQDKN